MEYNMIEFLSVIPVTWLLFLGYQSIFSEANLQNLNINSYPKNMSPCNDFITYFLLTKWTYLRVYHYTLFYKQPVYKQPDPGFWKLPEKLSNWTLKPFDIKQLIYTYRFIDNRISAQNVTFYDKIWSNFYKILLNLNKCNFNIF